MDAKSDDAVAFTITRNLAAPPARVFRAWTDPAELKHWWGPKGFTMQVCKVDLRPGGLFHYGMQTPDGQMMWGRFVYREIVTPERLVFVVSFSDEHGGITRNPWIPLWPLETLSTLTFAGQGGHTTLTMRGVPAGATDAECNAFRAGHASMQGGWGGTLDQLEDVLAKS